MFFKEASIDKEVQFFWIDVRIFFLHFLKLFKLVLSLGFMSCVYLQFGLVCDLKRFSKVTLMINISLLIFSGNKNTVPCLDCKDYMKNWGILSFL